MKIISFYYNNGYICFMNNGWKFISISFLLIVGCINQLNGQSISRAITTQEPILSVDSVLDNLFFYAPYYETAVAEYDSDIYLKVNLDILRKNYLIRYLPSMFRPRKGVRKYILETYSDLHYTAPNIYDHRVKATTGTTPRYRGAKENLLRYFNINVYSPVLFEHKLLSPLSETAQKHYNYKLTRVDKGLGDHLEYTIEFTPKSMSYQLLSGYVIVSDGVWSIREFEFSGKSEYFTFTNHIRMGEVGNVDEFVPLSYKINTVLRFVGNKMKADFHGVLTYNEIKMQKLTQPKVEKNKYDLTDSYILQCPDSVIPIDKNFFKYRKLPLTIDERKLYQEYTDQLDLKDSLATSDSSSKKSSKGVFWGELGDALVSNHTVDLYNIGKVKFSPLINPFLLSYSGKDGLSYKHKIKYNRLFSNDRILRITPTLGYNFKWREFYWRGTASFNYWPRKRSGLELNFGNGNRIYSSEVLDDIKGMTDTINFDKLNLDYFKNFNLSLMHTYEVLNGLSLDIGLSIHKRKSKGSQYRDSLEIPDDYKGRYVSVAPRARVTWTPGQYYYMNGKRKINLHSKYPTFTVDWERGLKGFLGGTRSHERIELDIQHKIPLGLMRNIYYRIGGGRFTNQDQIYFIDFIYFAKNNLPLGWNDDIGGTFQLLDRRWYNASRYYGRVNFVYETPFLLMPHFRKWTRSIINERIYANALMMNQLQPYIEVGYGIGTHIFDFGLFYANYNWNDSKIGVKITFELFNR